MGTARKLLCRIGGMDVSVIAHHDKLYNELKPYTVESGEPLFEIDAPDERLAAVREKSKIVPKRMPFELMEHFFAGQIFYERMPDFDGFMLHSSCVDLDGRAYLFSADSGVGKSTHTRLWRDHFGGRVKMLNDDKPLIRLIDGKYYACGTPWCGKHGLHDNSMSPIQAVAHIVRSEKNYIRRIGAEEAFRHLFQQTFMQIRDKGRMERLLALWDGFVENVSIYELGCNISDEAVEVAYNGMYNGIMTE